MMSSAQEPIAPVSDNATAANLPDKKSIRETLDAKLPQNNQQVEGEVDDIAVKFAAAGLKLVNRMMRWRDSIATGTLRLIEGKNGRSTRAPSAAPEANSGSEITLGDSADVSTAEENNTSKGEAGGENPDVTPSSTEAELNPEAETNAEAEVKAEVEANVDSGSNTTSGAADEDSEGDADDSS